MRQTVWIIIKIDLCGMKIVFCAFVIIKDLYIFSFFHNQLLGKVKVIVRKEERYKNIKYRWIEKDFECLRLNETREVKYQSL